jgi:hypothetical protein
MTLGLPPSFFFSRCHQSWSLGRTVRNGNFPVILGDTAFDPTNHGDFIVVSMVWIGPGMGLSEAGRL